eukprot:377874-Rhodomonas_salina.7
MLGARQRGDGRRETDNVGGGVGASLSPSSPAAHAFTRSQSYNADSARRNEWAERFMRRSQSERALFPHRRVVVRTEAASGAATQWSRHAEQRSKDRGGGSVLALTANTALQHPRLTARAPSSPRPRAQVLPPLRASFPPQRSRTETAPRLATASRRQVRKEGETAKASAGGSEVERGRPPAFGRSMSMP